MLTALVMDRVTGSTGLFDDAVELAVTALLFVGVCKFLRIPAAQPYVEITDRGIGYGRQQFIPWESVDKVEWVTRGFGRRYLVFRTKGWRGAGPISGLLSRFPLPLSRLDPKLDPRVWLDSFKTYAPESLPPP
jgi:hypothetical protein